MQRIHKEDLSDGEDEVIIMEEQEVNLDKIEEEMEQIYSSDEDEEAGWVQHSSNADLGQTVKYKIVCIMFNVIFIVG